MPHDVLDEFERRDLRKHAKVILDDPKHRVPPPGKEPLPNDTPDERGKPQPDAR